VGSRGNGSGCDGVAHRRSAPFHGGFTARGNAALTHRRQRGPVLSLVGNGEGSRHPRAPAGGSRSLVGNGEGSRHPRAPAARGAGAGGPVPAPRPAPLAFPHPGPPLVHDASGRDEEFTPRSPPRPLPIPCGDGTRGAGSCREVLCSSGERWENEGVQPPGMMFRGERWFAAPGWKPGAGADRQRPSPAQGGAPSNSPRSPPGNEAALAWSPPRQASPGLARPRQASPGLARPRQASPHAGSLHEVRSPVATTPSKTRILPSTAPRVPSPQGMGKGRGGDLGVNSSSRPDASCTSGGLGWGNARGAGRGAGTGPPAPAPLAAGARGWREPSPFPTSDLEPPAGARPRSYPGP
jgi:hypothetical protein